MNNRILVAYASRAGATAGVAEVIGQVLAAGGAAVEVHPMKEVNDLASYRAVVAGSAIRDKQWLPEAMQFLQTHQAALSRKPFAAFLVCITLAMPQGEAYRPFVADFLNPVRALVQPASEGLFAGAIDFDKVPPIPEGLQLRALSAMAQTPPGDYRDWAAVRAWAKGLRPLLLQQH